MTDRVRLRRSAAQIRARRNRLHTLHLRLFVQQQNEQERRRRFIVLQQQQQQRSERAEATERPQQVECSDNATAESAGRPEEPAPVAPQQITPIPRPNVLTNDFFIDNGTTVIEDCEASDEMCVICQSELNTRNLRKINTCGHMFHKACLDEWFKEDLKCPICRHHLIIDEIRRLQGVIFNIMRNNNTPLSSLFTHIMLRECNALLLHLRELSLLDDGGDRSADSLEGIFESLWNMWNNVV